MTAVAVDRSALTGFVADALGTRQAVNLRFSDEPGKAGWSAEVVMFDAVVGEGSSAVTLSLVMKRQIVGHDLIIDADIALQCRVMAALERFPQVPSPRLLATELTGAVLGAPFFVMHRLPGRIVPQNPNYHRKGWLADTAPAERARVWRNGIAAMAEVHRLDWRDGFAFLDRPGADAPGLPQWLAWIGRWLDWALAGRAHPTAQRALAWLKARAPAEAPLSLLWGDAIPANQLFGPAGEVTGIIDWEFAVLGPGEADLAWWLYFDELFSVGMHVPRLDGLPDRAECVAIYEAAAGRKVENLDYYLALAGLRMTIVSIRAVERLVALGRFKADNDAWLANPSSAWLARHLELAPVEVGPDFHAFTRVLFGAGDGAGA